MDLRQLAAILRISKPSAWRLVSTGKIRADLRATRKIVISQAELRRFLSRLVDGTSSVTPYTQLLQNDSQARMDRACRESSVEGQCGSPRP